MRPTYENVYIGTFIFSLGYMFSSEKRGSRTSVAIELYQQTRNGERLVGDLLTSIGGKCIIVEFKRDHTELAKELRKESKAPLRRMLQSVTDSRFVEISKRCHYIAIAAAYPDSNAQCLAFLPYVDLAAKDQEARQWVGDTNFCKRYISPNSFECGVSPEDFTYYIGKLAEATGGTCGGLAVSVDKDGLKSAIVFEDVRELSKGLVQAEQEAERTIQRLEHSRSGPSLGR